MKKDMVKYLFDLFDKVAPEFQQVFAVEYPKLTDEEQLRFLRLLNADMKKVVEKLQKMEPEALSAAA